MSARYCPTPCSAPSARGPRAVRGGDGSDSSDLQRTRAARDKPGCRTARTAAIAMAGVRCNLAPGLQRLRCHGA